MVLKRIPAATVVTSALFAQFSAVHAETTWRQVLSTEADHNIIEFAVPYKDVSWLERHGFRVSKFDTRNVVSRFSDPTFLDCAKNAGLIPIFKYGPKIVGQAFGVGVPPLVDVGLDMALSAQNVESYHQCETDWLKRIADARVEYKFDVIEAALGQTDTFDSEMTANFLALDDQTHGAWTHH